MAEDKYTTKEVPIFVRVNDKGIEYSWDKGHMNDKDRWQFLLYVHIPIRHDPGIHIIPALYMALTDLP